jgi:hypothetical protein
MHSSDRGLLRACLSAALIAASTLWAAHAFAQGNPPNPNTAPPSTSTQPAPSTKSLSDTAPKAILVDPCKAKNPPSYCGKH